MRFLLLLYHTISLACLCIAQSPIVPGAYILELNPIIDFSKHPFRTTNLHVQEFRNAATAANIHYNVRYEFNNPDIFLGLSIQVTDTGKSDAEMRRLLNAIPGVVSVSPVEVIEASQPPGEDEAFTLSNSQTLAFEDDPELLGPFTGGDLSSSLRMGGIDKLHKLGIKGKGIKIGIIDSGIDYRHPALGGKFGPGNKIAGGYAFANDRGAPVMEEDPLTTCYAGGHGTHVAGNLCLTSCNLTCIPLTYIVQGIIGMESGSRGFDIEGVAPEATIFMYRVTGCGSGGSTDALIKVFTKAFEDGVDIVSISMGLLTRNDPYQKVTDRLTEAGVFVVVSLGNDAAADPRQEHLYTGATPAIESNVVAVGSVVNSHFPTVYSANDSVNNIRYASVYPVNLTEEADVYILEDPCNRKQLEEAERIRASNMANTIFATPRIQGVRTCLFSFGSKEPGIQYIMLLMPESQNIFNTSRADPYSASYPAELSTGNPQFLFVDAADSAKLLQTYKSFGGHQKYKLSFKDKTLSSVPYPAGGLMDFYSSFGPSATRSGGLLLKPQLSAPGGAILSTTPLGPLGGGYAIYQGTSMATPYISGCLALLKSQFLNETQFELLSRLQVTSAPVQWAYNASMLAGTMQQGAGLVNAYDAIFSTTRISPSQLNIEDDKTRNIRITEIRIENTSNRSQQYVFSHTGAGFMYKSLYNNELNQMPIFGKVKFDLKNVTLPSLTSAVISLTISPPRNTTHEGLYSGFVKIISKTVNQTFSIPYVGRVNSAKCC
ncbi:Subtilisin-like protein [Glarea lozoyensis ATCC 20868]|uniref:Subtilisin-like protein n=1 Tax=Glarea lozoyensis (strain ATCC 20868 / MF5171) TaxID=1116229 RepID=S3CYC2_GLAL2|nr:Subtilisin-like protein [Glarea lozoyensis ATCC 20868]EPE29964.1 Subtilisin-like protein [Glarea lozoyensis ATCC 20868]